MDINEIPFLPGLEQQLKFLLEKVEISNKSILVIGSNTEQIARKLIKTAKEVLIIVDDQEDLLKLRFNLSDTAAISIRYMEYTNTDFINKKFDIIYAQGSVTRKDRNKILKEFKKILVAEGFFCAGEIVALTVTQPQFIKDIWDQSNLTPLTTDKVESYYEERGFRIVETKELTDTLREFYTLSRKFLQESIADLPKEEAKFYKKILSRIKHESDVYLKLGGDKYIGFKCLLLKNAAE